MCLQTDEQVTYYIELPEGKIPVYRFGDGAKLMIALHGFESNGQAYAEWAEILGNQYTICAPDLPFHGQSVWRQNNFNSADMETLILAIAAQEQQSSYTLCGFSLGARIIVCTAPHLATQIEDCILLAPAGIGSYDKVIPLFLQNILERLLAWTTAFKFIVDQLHRLGWLSNFHKRYAEVQIYPADRRYRLFRLFNSILDFSTTKAGRHTFWQTTNTSLKLILGARDKMVPNDKIKAYFAQTPQCASIIIDAKHDLVNKQVAKLLV